MKHQECNIFPKYKQNLVTMTQHYANEGKQIKSLLLLANTIAVAKFFLRQ